MWNPWVISRKVDFKAYREPEKTFKKQEMKEEM